MSDLFDAALEVHRLAVEKGMLFATDPVTKSDKLVGFFVPAHEMNELGNALFIEKIRMKNEH